MIKRFLFLLVTSYLSLVTIMGCGYTTRSMISDKFRTIYVVPFVNKIDITKESDAANRYKIYKIALETDVTRAVINKYLFDGNLKPVKKEYADLELKGEVVEFRRDPVAYDDNENVTEYRINVVVNISLWDKKEDKLAWEEKNFTGDTTYYTSYATGLSIVTQTDDAAVVTAVADLARRIVERTVEQW